MRHVLGALTQIQLARIAAPDLVEWTTTIRGVDMAAHDRVHLSEAERAERRSGARGAMARTVWR
jgi:hypothetical protein